MSTMTRVTRVGRRLHAIVGQRRLGAQLVASWILSLVVIVTLRPSFALDDSTPARLSGTSVLWLMALCAVATIVTAYTVKHWADL